ncbi:MAG: undecaprenyl-diphosphate phosphatase [Bacteroidetes Order II. Incertae sedis bacterium]|jgi:undecaprenyl-diphosphatase|nr:undecaprenyl-diphosphate phosphatase [Bacteroidetes Order II. bacterium]MBT4051529.1 undecaprenyl-diphosphate phosphatase [Bacteroidetes Order II. bacterium]MBT4602312.1 undecaprenyl-diphosphate phosphatase [Bacteroidetes Order II. bacterium]MBT5249396.1 undecaprenyl-diphosphate phosphatase [Bacteroidetes Order II. bacterium]MBT6199739.1 undecaprenyl-diphosphate phosphatase [Bacteroidetes Order II. bacterium]
MNWWESVILGLVQGLTEFLPVSSSGHLVLGQHLLGLETAAGDVLFEVLVHFGTIMSVFWVYRERIQSLTIGFCRRAVRVSELGQSYKTDEHFRMGVQILITMIPTFTVYAIWGSEIEAAFGSPKLASGMLLVTGVLLLLTRLRRAPSGQITAPKSFLIGLAQSAAMIPGISRSGATICTALYQNVEPSKAADFSFLMLLPVVIGATIFKIGEALGQAAVADWGVLLLGTLVAFISGIAAIRLVLDVVRRGRLQYFAIYCFIAGGLGLILI